MRIDGGSSLHRETTPSLFAESRYAAWSPIDPSQSLRILVLLHTGNTFSVPRSINIASPPIMVTAGDYFELVASFSSSQTVNTDATTFFSIEEVQSGIKSCLVYGSGQSLTSNTDTALSFSSVDHDPYSMWSAGSPTLLTVPSECTNARPYYGLKGQLNSTTYIHVQSSTAPGFANARGGVSGDYQRMSGVTPWLQVTPDNTFFFTANPHGATITANAYWFAMEFF